MLKHLKLAVIALSMSVTSLASAGDFITYNNGLDKINLNQVVYAKKADAQDATTFYLTNGSTVAAVPGTYQQVLSDSRFINDGNYYVNATNSGKAVNSKLIVSAKRGPGYQGNSQVTYTMVGGTVLILDMGAEAFLGSYWSNLY